jgi:hypothetical protein
MSSKSPWNAFSALFVKPPEAPVYTPEPELEAEPEPEPILNTSGSPEIVEGRPYADIYVAANVPTSAFPVEKLLAVIEGLANMSPDQIRMVIAAMDAADSSWVIEDPVTDAQNKIVVLQSEQARLSSTIKAIEAQGQAEAATEDEDLLAMSADIKSQIETLQADLQAAILETTQAKTQIETYTRSSKEAAARETARLESEVRRLNRVPNTFGGKI